MSNMLNKNKKNTCPWGCCKYDQHTNHQARQQEKRNVQRLIVEETDTSAENDN